MSAGHVSQVSGSTRYSPPPHCAQSLRTEAPSVMVNMEVVVVPLGMVQQRVRLNDEALSNIDAIVVTWLVSNEDKSPLNDEAYMNMSFIVVTWLVSQKRSSLNVSYVEQ